MSFLADHFWKILFLIIAACLGYWQYLRYQEKQKWEIAAKNFGASLALDKTSHNQKAEEVKIRFYKNLGRLHECFQRIDKGDLEPRKHKDLGEDISDPRHLFFAEVWKQAGQNIKESYFALSREIFTENYRICEKYGVFSDPAGLRSLLDGKPPTITKGPFQGEKLIMTQRVPILYARDACYHPLNLTLIPESILGLRDETNVDDYVFDAANDLFSIGVVSKNSRDSLKRMFDEQRK